MVNESLTAHELECMIGTIGGEDQKEDSYILVCSRLWQAIAMSEELQATLERIAEQQEANTTVISTLIERQAQNETTIARLLQMTERLAPQVIENTERLNDLSRRVWSCNPDANENGP